MVSMVTRLACAKYTSNGDLYFSTSFWFLFWNPLVFSQCFSPFLKNHTPSWNLEHNDLYISPWEWGWCGWLCASFTGNLRKLPHSSFKFRTLITLQYNRGSIFYGSKPLTQPQLLSIFTFDRFKTNEPTENIHNGQYILINNSLIWNLPDPSMLSKIQ